MTQLAASISPPSNRGGTKPANAQNYVDEAKSVIDRIWLVNFASSVHYRAG